MPVQGPREQVAIVFSRCLSCVPSPLFIDSKVLMLDDAVRTANSQSSPVSCLSLSSFSSSALETASGSVAKTPYPSTQWSYRRS